MTCYRQTLTVWPGKSILKKKLKNTKNYEQLFGWLWRVKEITVLKSVMEVLSSRVVALSFSLVMNALMISRSHPSRARPGAVSLSSQAWSISGWGIFALEHHDKCEHNRSCQWQKMNWIRFVKPHYLRIFATKLQYFILHFWNTSHLHWGSTELLWSKKRYVPNKGPLRDIHGTLKKVIIFCYIFLHSHGSNNTGP